MKRQVGLLIVTLLLAGCTLAPKYVRAPGEVPQEYRFQSLQGQPQPGLDTLADLSWWEIFDDQELQSLIRTALEQNYDVLLAAARVAEVRARVGVSRSLWLPQAGGAYGFQGALAERFPIPFSSGEEERETDCDRLVRTQGLQNLQSSEPCDRPLSHFFAAT